MADHILGIDLGTSNSCMASYVGSKAEVIRNSLGDSLTPSVVAFGADDSLLVGSPARRQAILNPTSTFFEVKRLCGRRFDEAQVQEARRLLPYEIVKATNGDAWVAHKGRPISPPEIQAWILESLRKNAMNYWNTDITKAVITVPAFFDETQRQAVRDAATLAGLEAVRILSEPTAAAVAYGHAQFDGRVVVVDFGGGTLDITLMDIRDGKFTVLATDGDNVLGGADFDKAIASHFAEIVKRESGMDPLEDMVARQRLMSEAEQAKKVLSAQSEARVEIQYLLESTKGPVNLTTTLTREQLGSLVRPLIERIAKPCEAVMGRIGLRAADIDDVLLVGGMSRSPMVQTRITEIFQRKASQRINPDEAIALGAAIAAAGISGELPEAKLVDVAPRSIGLAAAGDKFVPLIRASQPLPAAATKRFGTTKDNQDSFNLVVWQGESAKASENRRLARVTIDSIPPGPKGSVMLDVTFKMNESGALHVDAKTGDAHLSAPIQALSGLTRAQVAQLAADRASARSEKKSAVSADGGVKSDAELLGNFSVDFLATPAATPADVSDASKPLEFDSPKAASNPEPVVESASSSAAETDNPNKKKMLIAVALVVLALALIALALLIS